jgi:hypothetical protein
MEHEQGARTFEYDERTYVYLDTAEQANTLVSDEDIVSALGWFEEKKGVPAQDFIDKLAKHGGYADTPWDIDSYDNEAARRLLARARRIKREQQEWG